MKKNTVKALSRVFITLLVLTAVFCIGATGIFAADGETAAAANSSMGMGIIGAALSTGLACIGAGIAVAAGAPAAIGALTEDAKTFGKSLIFVALGEGIALYGMLISILILNKF